MEGGGGLHEQRPKINPPPTNKHKSLHLSTLLPQDAPVLPPGSLLCWVTRAREAFRVCAHLPFCLSSDFQPELSVAGLCVCVRAAVIVRVQWTLLTWQGWCWGVYPPGPEPLGPIRGCKYFMRYDSGAQTLLNHRPLTVFSGYVPFGKVRNNEINKHPRPPVTAGALWGLHAARLLMRGSVQFTSCGGREKKIIGQYSKISKISSQPAPQEDSARVCPPSSPSLLLIPSCSNCFCYACSGKIKLSFVRTSQLDKAACTKRRWGGGGGERITGDSLL